MRAKVKLARLQLVRDYAHAPATQRAAAERERAADAAAATAATAGAAVPERSRQMEAFHAAPRELQEAVVKALLDEAEVVATTLGSCGRSELADLAREFTLVSHATGPVGGLCGKGPSQGTRATRRCCGRVWS
jgi:predicted 2-oxoglutarate/Fe(II)-dependent dioxygenase YbiX